MLISLTLQYSTREYKQKNPLSLVYDAQKVLFLHIFRVCFFTFCEQVLIFFVYCCTMMKQKDGRGDKMYRKQETVIFSLCILLACQMITSMFVPNVQNQLLHAAVSLFTYAVCLSAPTFFLTFKCNVYKDENVYPKKPIACAVFCAGVIYFGNAFSIFLSHIFVTFGLHVPSGITTYTEIPAIILSFINFVLLPPILEELLVRRYILSHLLPYSKTQAVIFSTLVFGFFHMNLLQIPFALVCGFIFGYFTVKTSSVKFSVTMHFLNNLVAFILSYHPLPDSQTLSFAVWIPTLIATVVSAIVLYKNGYFREKMQLPDCSTLSLVYFAVCLFVGCLTAR